MFCLSSSIRNYGISSICGILDLPGLRQEDYGERWEFHFCPSRFRGLNKSVEKIQPFRLTSAIDKDVGPCGFRTSVPSSRKRPARTPQCQGQDHRFLCEIHRRRPEDYESGPNATQCFWYLHQPAVWTVSERPAFFSRFPPRLLSVFQEHDSEHTQSPAWTTLNAP